MARSAREVVDEIKAELRNPVPPGPDWVCRACLGPQNSGYPFCYACERMFGLDRGAGFIDRIVPVTVAVKGEPWYRRLSTYKGGWPQNRLYIGAVFGAFVGYHRDRIEGELLKGSVDLIVPVPSRRVDFERQALVHSLRLLEAFSGLVSDVIRFDPSAQKARRAFRPEDLRVDQGAVDGKRILVVEDVWVSGASAASTAGALLDAGAEAVAVVPIARVVETPYWDQQGHPYTEVLMDESREYDLELWPRGGG
jgi:hypothetical protein